MRPSEFDVVFISYDEPNSEYNYADLLQKCPWAKRVHGVKGFDAAHKAAGEKSSTNNFITVDGDSIVDSRFFDQDLNLWDLESTVHSWASRNNINGLIYGNGGLKIWPKELVLRMSTHESSNSSTTVVDFCWEHFYKDHPEVFSVTKPHGSAFQAFRTGFREGVKLSLLKGHQIGKKRFLDTVDPSNVKRLSVWCSIGDDVEFGRLAQYGARLAHYWTVVDNWVNWDSIRDYDWFMDLWQNNNFVQDSLDNFTHLGEEIKCESGLPLADFDEEQSKMFKYVMPYEELKRGP